MPKASVKGNMTNCPPQGVTVRINKPANVVLILLPFHVGKTIVPFLGMNKASCFLEEELILKPYTLSTRGKIVAKQANGDSIPSGISHILKYKLLHASFEVI